MHHACSTHAEGTVPSLDDWEKDWQQNLQRSVRSPFRGEFNASLVAPYNFEA